MTALQIRDAVASDAEAACVVMRRSIAELCVADHRDDPRSWRNGWPTSGRTSCGAG
jgi:hypothetical protein